jgi:hypothetical protein
MCPGVATSRGQDTLKAAAAERHIQQLVATWPPLTSAQRNRLATLLATDDPAPALPPPEPVPDPRGALRAAVADHPGSTFTDLAALLDWSYWQVRRVMQRLEDAAQVVATQGDGPSPSLHWRLATPLAVPEPEREGAGDG